MVAQSHSGDRAVLHATRPDGAAAPTPLPARLAAAILPVAAASLLGGWVTRPKIPTWYAGLAKPAFTPPNGAFAPVWTLLFGLMAYALWRVLSRPAGPARTRAAAAFFGQLALNVAWSFAFFGLESPGLALAVIAALLAAILATIGLFRPLDRVAAWLLAPYAAWVAYAAAVNLGVLILN
jgi:translocator protein